MVKPIPDGYTAVTPYLIVDDAPKEIEFLKAAFGAVQVGRLDTPDGQVMHAAIKIDGASIMISSAMPPQHKAIPAMLYIYVTDVDATYAKAVAFPGVTAQMPPTDQFYGDRSGSLTSSNGIIYWIASQKEVLTHEQVGQRVSAMTKDKK